MEEEHERGDTRESEVSVEQLQSEVESEVGRMVGAVSRCLSSDGSGGAIVHDEFADVDEPETTDYLESYDDDGGVADHDPDAAEKAAERVRELDKMEEFGVVTYVPIADVGEDYLRLKTRWVEEIRGSSWRCRVVGKDFKKLDPHMDGLYTPGSSNVCHRLVDIYAGTHGFCRRIGDATNAYFHTPQNRKVVIEWFDELRVRAERQGIDATRFSPVLARKLYGERDASVEFAEYFNSALTKAGFERCTAQPQLYKGASGLVCELHQDDVHMCGPVEDMLRACEVISGMLQMKWSKVLEPGDRYTFLKANRIIMQDFGTFLAPSGRYIRDMLVSMDLVGSKSAPTPISQMRTDPEEKAIVEESRIHTYRRVVSIARYLRQYRPDIGFAVKCLSHGLQAPTETEWAMLKRLCRYLAGSVNHGVILPGLAGSSDEVAYLEAWSDSDWAADRVTRKSTSSCILMYRGALIFDSSKQQSLIAQSSGEAEVYAAASSVSSALLIEGVLRWLGLPVKGIKLKVDSTTCKAVISRLGVGAIRHLAVKVLWLQALHKQKMVEVEKTPGEENIADLGTKILQPQRFVKLVTMIGMRSMDVESKVEQKCIKPGGVSTQSSSSTSSSRTAAAAVVALLTAAQGLVESRAEEVCIATQSQPDKLEEAANTCLRGPWQLWSALLVIYTIAVVWLGAKFTKLAERTRESDEIGIASDSDEIGMVSDSDEIGIVSDSDKSGIVSESDEIGIESGSQPEPIDSRESETRATNR
eukprot:6461117-Amphidinium_carterae.2